MDNLPVSPQPQDQPSPAPFPRRRMLIPLSWQMMQYILLWSVIAATLFTLWTPENFMSNTLLDKMKLAMQPTRQNNPSGLVPTATPAAKPHIGVVAGHLNKDKGFTCKDGLQEVDLNQSIAGKVKDILTKKGYTIDLMGEFDAQLKGYKAGALVSIHNDACDWDGDSFTGFKVAPSDATRYLNEAARLSACLAGRYSKATGLKMRQNEVTQDMSDYHPFSEIDPMTIAVVMETGYMNRDKDFLKNKQDLIAQGISDGIVCYLNNEGINK